MTDQTEQQGLLVQQVSLPPLDMAHPVFWDSGLDAGAEVRIMWVGPAYSCDDCDVATTHPDEGQGRRNE